MSRYNREHPSHELSVFTEQTVVAGTSYYSDSMQLVKYDGVGVHVTSSGTVNANITLQTRSRPLPAAGVYVNDDDGYWFTEPNVTFSGTKGDFDKCSDMEHLNNVVSPNARVRIDVVAGGTLAIYATYK